MVKSEEVCLGVYIGSGIIYWGLEDENNYLGLCDLWIEEDEEKEE